MRQKVLVLAVILLASLLTVIPALADAPDEGTVYEGVSVPGILLGDTRADVEAAYGPPSSCRSNNDPDNMESCSFDVEGGGWVSVFYQGPDGSVAAGSPDDVVSTIRWGGEEVVGWETTAGINIRQAKYDKQAAIEAYPEAELYYDSVGRLYLLRDPELGIQVNWNHAYIFYTVSMAIFNPYTPTPPPDYDYMRVADIELWSPSKHTVAARALVLDEQNRPVEGAVVDVTWLAPKDNSFQVSDTTTNNGYATFTIDKARRGTYYFSISNVSLDGYVYDNAHSTTFAAFFNK